MTTVVVPPPRRPRWEAIHGALALAALLHLAGLGAWSLRTPGAAPAPVEERPLRVVARVERLEALPRPAPLPRRSGPPALPRAETPPLRGSAPPLPAPPSRPARSEDQDPGLPALPGVSFPTAPSVRLPAATLRGPALPAPRPAPLPSPRPRPVAPTPAAAAPAPPPTSGQPRWAWVPGPDQPRLVHPGTVPAGGTGVPGTARAWVALRIPAGGGASTSPVDLQVLEIETPSLTADGEARLRTLVIQVARSSRWRPGTRDGQPADHVLRLLLELPGP